MDWVGAAAQSYGRNLTAKKSDVVYQPASGKKHQRENKFHQSWRWIMKLSGPQRPARLSVCTLFTLCGHTQTRLSHAKHKRVLLGEMSRAATYLSRGSLEASTLSSNSRIIEARTGARSGASCSVSRSRHRSPGSIASDTSCSLMTATCVKEQTPILKLSLVVFNGCYCVMSMQRVTGSGGWYE